MSLQRKPTIVFCHGIWADGSCFSKVIPALQAEGHEVIAVQYGLDSFEEAPSPASRQPSSGLPELGHSMTWRKSETSDLRWARGTLSRKGRGEEAQVPGPTKIP